jgi:septum formation protein
MTALILASASEWRAKLLQQAGFEFEVIPTDLDESPYQQSIHDPKQLVETLALKKAELCVLKLRTTNNEPRTVLAADTIVWAANQIIGKPTDRQDAKRIITLLAGTTHEVWTGVCIRSNTTQIFSDVAKVTFRQMSDDEIETYLDTNDWVGKAGAYQLQKNIGKFVTHIDGDEGTIIGLPNQVIRDLREIEQSNI